jgi:(p)ppGpp synthase/HD superfamily hydrolase
MKEKILETLYFLSTKEKEQMWQAISLATFAHEGQVRKGGEPYVNHVLRVGVAVAKHFAKNDKANALIATISAILHDVVEDTEVTEQEVRKQFSDNDNVADIVMALSHSLLPDGSVNDDEPDEEYLPRIERGGGIAIIIKRFDVLDNLASLKDTPKDFREKNILGQKSRMNFWERTDPEGAKMIARAIKDAGE